MSKKDMMQRIEKARQAGFSDDQIYSSLVKDQGYAKRVSMAKKEGFTDQTIANQFGLTLHKSLGVMPTITIKAEPEYEQPSFLADVGSGMDRVFSGIKQGALYAKDAVTGGDDYDKYTKAKAEERKYFEEARKKSGKGMNVGGFIGETVATLPVAALAKGFQGANVLSQAGAKVLGQNALVGAGIGGVGFADDAEQRMGNTAAGALGGAVGGVVGKKIGDGVSRGYNAVKNNIKPNAKEILDEGAKHNVRTSVGDAGRGSFTKRSEVLMENVPVVGMAGFREAQQQEAKIAVNKVVESLRGKMTDTDYKSLNKIQLAASQGDKNAIRIMDIVSNAGEDSGKILQAAAEIKNWRGQQIVSELYERAAKAAGNSQVSANKTLQAIDDVIAADSKTIPNNELLSELNAIKRNWLDPSNPKTFGELRAAQSRLGELVDEWGRNGKHTSGLTKIRTAIDDDLADFASNSGKPQLVHEYKRANDFYKKLQGSKDKALANSMRSNESDQIYKTFIQFGKGDKAANFYRNLDPKGQAALRYEMANRALGKATNESTGDFSPAKFAHEFERMSEPYSNIFNKTDKAHMDGFVKLMRHIERAGQYMENPPTGNRLVGMAIGGTAVANMPLAIKAASASAIAKVLFTTNAGKRILLASKDLPPNSHKLANLLQQAQKLAVATGATATTD